MSSLSVPAASATPVKVAARLLMCTSASALLAACGGGGDAGTSAPAAVPSVVAAAAVTADGPAPTDAVQDQVEAGDGDADDDETDATPSTPEVVAAETGADAEVAPAPEAAPEAAPQSVVESVAEPGSVVPDLVAQDLAEPTLDLESGEIVMSTGEGQTALLQGQTVTTKASGGNAAVGFDVDPGPLTLQYQGGNETERVAQVRVDPTDGQNHVLEFLLMAPNVRDDDGVPLKGRVQLNAYAADTVRSKEIRLKLRMNLADGFEQLRSLDSSFRWLTLSEWWNDAGWTGQGYPFRITLDVIKPAAQPGSRLFFALRAETLNLATRKWDTTVWSKVNTAVPAPIGRWVTLEYHFREGDENAGRFYLAMVPDGGDRVILFDQRGWTHHPDNPAPDGLTHLNPAKLYTSKALVEHAAASGHPLRVHWDDLAFRLCRDVQDPEASPCGPQTFR